MVHFINFLFAVAIIFLPCAVHSADNTSSNSANDTKRKLVLIELFSMSNQLPRDLIDLQSNIEDLKGAEAFKTELPIYENRIKELTWNISVAESSPDISYHHLSLLDTNLEKTKLNIDKLHLQVTENVDLLQGWYKEWLDREEEFTLLKESKKVMSGPDNVTETVEAIEKNFGEAKTLIESHLVPNLTASKEISAIQTQVYALNDKVTHIIEDINDSRLQQTSPSMFSLEFYRHLDMRMFNQAWQNVRLFIIYQWDYLKNNFKPLFFTTVAIAILCLFIYFSKNLVVGSSPWSEYAARPLTTAVFIVGICFSCVYSLSTDIILPPDWETLLQLPLIFTVACFAGFTTKVDWQNRLLGRLVLLSAAATLLTLMKIPPRVIYLFAFYSTLMIFITSFYNFMQRRKSPKTRKITWAIGLWGFFPLVLIFIGIGGYDQLAILLFTRVLTLVVTTLTIYHLLIILAGLLEVSLLYVPLPIVRNNNATIVQQLFPILAILLSFIWLSVIILFLFGYPTLDTSFEAILSLKMNVFSIEVTPGSVFIVVIVCYTTILCSRAIRAFLKNEVLPRYDAEKGVQVSISKLAHYATLSIGFLILLRMLGFGFQQIAILGGALSVGIGFGLQAIVNNFVSGLILLFERPIKLGDMIEVGDEMGEVKELGLRATTVQTLDHAEIVIPNSELVTGSVVNWTLAERLARVRVPVGVAYGSDIEKVLRILFTCANDNPLVLSTPKPQALFLAFGSSSLDFELRVWIPNVIDKFDVLSELNQDIEYEFQTAGIEIPFPQRDLHLRSVDPAISQSLAPGRSASDPVNSQKKN